MSELSMRLDAAKLVSVVQHDCPADAFWLYEMLFPVNSDVFSESGVFNLIDIVEESTGAATYTDVCALTANEIESGLNINLSSVTAPKIWESISLGVNDICSLVVTKSGRKLETLAEKQEYAAALKVALFVKRVRKALVRAAAELLKDGKMIVSGDKIKSYTIDYGRNANNVVTVDAAEVFTAGTSKAMDMLEVAVSELMPCDSAGNVDVIFSTKGWNQFKASAQVKDIRDAQNAAGCCETRKLNMDLYPDGTSIVGGKAVGSYNSLVFWVFDGKQEVGDEAVRLLDENDVYLVDREAFGGKRGIGGMEDFDGKYGKDLSPRAERINSKALKIEVEYRPLPIVSNPNAVVVIKGAVA